MEATETETQEPEKKKPMSSAERVRRMNAAKAAKRAAASEKEAKAKPELDAEDAPMFEKAARVNCTCGENLVKPKGGTKYSCIRILTAHNPTKACQRNLPEKNADGTWRIYSEGNIHLAPKSKHDVGDDLED